MSLLVRCQGECFYTSECSRQRYGTTKKKIVELQYQMCMTMNFRLTGVGNEKKNIW